MKEEIVVLIKKDGEIQAEVNGVKGKKCIEITAFISALGEASGTLKREYFQQDTIRIPAYLKIGKGVNTHQEAG